MSNDHFTDRLIEATEKKRSHVMLGLDPDYDSLPAEIRQACPPGSYGSESEMKADCFRRFLGGLLERLAR